MAVQWRSRTNDLRMLCWSRNCDLACSAEECRLHDQKQKHAYTYAIMYYIGAYNVTNSFIIVYYNVRYSYPGDR
jgi:hypothetical protein